MSDDYIADLLAGLHRDQLAALAAAREAERQADLIGERIRGIEEARAALNIEGNGAVPQRPRRDIRALVDELRQRAPLMSVENMAAQIGCRTAQVRKALEQLKAIDLAQSKL